MLNTSPSELLQMALAYASFGWAVFPVHSIRDGRCTCGRPSCTSPGKHPLTRHGHRDASTDPAVVAAWWKKHPWANIAVATGERSGRLMVIDLDNKPDEGIDGEETWRQLAKDAPATVEVLTGGGGRHLYFTYPEGLQIKSAPASSDPGSTSAPKAAMSLPRQACISQDGDTNGRSQAIQLKGSRSPRRRSGR
ncbi:MAG: bifunctional DNA primase/polymerase [Calditrichaeota bacterium]|nr:bifunctional DNA primase/polymerase [Calditrichota bacterium]